MTAATANSSSRTRRRPVGRFPLPRFFQKRFRHVILHITERCNLNCKSCFVRKSNRELSLDDAKIVAQKLGRPRWLDIGGGEPFLHPHLKDICALFPYSDLTIPTNGQNPECIEDCVKAIAASHGKALTIALSLDGFEGCNDFIRGKGSFEHALECYKRLRRLSGITLKINTVVCNANADSLLDFMAFVRELNPDYHSLLLIRGEPEEESLALPSPAFLQENTEAILKILASYLYGNKGNPVLALLKKRYQRYLWQVSMKTLEENRCIVPCQAPWLHRVVYADGSLAMCELMPVSGNLLEQSLNGLEKAMAKALKDQEALHGACFCTHNCNMAENIMTHPPSVLSVLLGMRP
jgi:MoaA/NifB/PqqE/SkfB family radical SAM enzyme